MVVFLHSRVLYWVLEYHTVLLLRWISLVTSKSVYAPGNLTTDFAFELSTYGVGMRLWGLGIRVQGVIEK